MKFVLSKAKHCILLVVLTLLLSGCPNKNSAKETSTEKAHPVSDKPLADYQIKLLDKAIEVANDIPEKPFIKDRSKAQQLVVETCLQLDQPVRAVKYADQIENWRRGLCYAEIAFYLAQEGHDAQHIEKGLEMAEQIAQMDHNRQWRNQKIKSKISQTYTLLGNSGKADIYSQMTDDPNATKMAEVENLSSSEKSFDQQVELIDNAVALMNFDITIESLYAYASLFNEYYDDAENRDLAEQKIETIAQKHRIPVNIRLDVIIKLTEYAIDKSDNNKTTELIDKAEKMLSDYQWPLQNYIPYSAKVIELQYKSGDKENASKQADDLYQRYNETGSKITDIYRAQTLRPLAEAYQAMGDPNTALTIYKQVIEEGVANPNPRPRAEDLSATCCSMAVSEVEPDAQLWSRICQIHEELVKSW